MRIRVVFGDDSQTPPYSAAMLCTIANQQAEQIVHALMLLQICPEITRIEQNVLWNTPTSNMFKVNTDVSIKDGIGKAYGGGVVRGSDGRWLGGFVVNIGICPILVAEAWCVFYGLEYALSLGLKVVQLECDNLLVVNMINDIFAINLLVNSMVGRIRVLMTSFDSVSVSHIHREGNFIADALSHHAYDFSPGLHTLPNPPAGVHAWLFHDLVGATYVR